MRLWKRLLVTSRSSFSGRKAPRRLSPRAAPRVVACVACGTPSQKKVTASLQAHNFTFDVCSDPCGRQISRLFTPGTVIDQMLPTLVSGAAVVLPPGTPELVARVKESIERQLGKEIDEGPFELTDTN